MSDNCLHIVPVHQEDYPNTVQKAKEILAWFQDRDLVETEATDCTLGEKGYRFKPNIAALFKDGETWAYRKDLHTHGLEISTGKRQMFCAGEGMYLEISCPNCNTKINEDLGYKWIGDWFSPDKTDTPTCPHCQQTRHLTEYGLTPNCAFSNIGVSLWNTHWDIKPETIAEMELLFGTKVSIIIERI